MELNYKKTGSGRPLVILHGLFGSSDNWYSIGKVLSQHYTTYIPDARNHGYSPHHSEHNYDVMVEDLHHFIQSNINESVTIIGHSMGGKVAMYFALLYPQWVEKLIVVDISPRSYTGLLEYEQHPLDLMNIANALMAIDLSQLISRNDADIQLSLLIPDKNLRAFLLKNIIRNSDGNYSWCFNLDVLRKNIPDMVGSLKYQNVEMINNSTVETLFIRGEKSDYIKLSDIELIKKIFPKSIFATIPNAGHWPQAEQPALFIKELLNYLGLS